MAKLTFGRLSEAWAGEAKDFTPLLAEQLDALGDAIGVPLASVGEAEVPTAGNRRIDIVATGDDGSEFVVENQYRTADHDHLTRGLAYAVARRARGLVLVAEEHRDEFRAVAQYLNELAEHDLERGVSIWLVEAKAVRIDDSAWAPLFTAVVEPNEFTATVELAKQTSGVLKRVDDFWELFGSPELWQTAQQLHGRWVDAGYRQRLGPNHMVLEAEGPSTGGFRTVATIYPDGRVMVPFSSYGGANSGIPIDALTTAEFRSAADGLFGFAGTEQMARTTPGWLSSSTLEAMWTFCKQVAEAYAAALDLETNANDLPTAPTGQA